MIGNKIFKGILLVMATLALSSCANFQTEIDQRYRSVVHNDVQIAKLNPQAAGFISSDYLRQSLKANLRKTLMAQPGDVEIVALSPTYQFVEQGILLRADFELIFKAQQLQVSGEFEGLASASLEDDDLVFRSALRNFRIDSSNTLGGSPTSQVSAVKLLEQYRLKSNGYLFVNSKIIPLGWRSDLTFSLNDLIEGSKSAGSETSPVAGKFGKSSALLVNQQGVAFMAEVTNEAEYAQRQFNLDNAQVKRRYAQQEFAGAFQSYQQSFGNLWSAGGFEQNSDTTKLSLMYSKQRLAAMFNQLFTQPIEVTQQYSVGPAGYVDELQMPSSAFNCQMIRAPFQRAKYQKTSCDLKCDAKDSQCNVIQAECEQKEDSTLFADHSRHEAQRQKHHANQEPLVQECLDAQQNQQLLTLGKLSGNGAGSAQGHFLLSSFSFSDDLEQVFSDRSIDVKGTINSKLRIEPSGMGTVFFCDSAYQKTTNNNVQLLADQQQGTIRSTHELSEDGLQLRVVFAMIEDPVKISPSPLEVILNDSSFARKCASGRAALNKRKDDASIANILGSASNSASQALLGSFKSEFPVAAISKRFKPIALTPAGAEALRSQVKWNQRTIQYLIED